MIIRRLGGRQRVLSENLRGSTASAGVSREVVFRFALDQQHHHSPLTNPVVAVVGLEVRPVNPVQNVQRAVGTHKEHVVRGEVLHLAVALEHDDLWHDGNALKEDREGPQQLHYVERVLHQEHETCQAEARQDAELEVQKRVVGAVVLAFERFLEAEHVHDVGGRPNVEDLHQRIVNGIVRGEEVEVARHEHEQEHLSGRRVVGWGEVG